MKFGIYRDTRTKDRMGFSNPPKLLKVVEADNVYDAAVKFCNAQPKGWRDRIIELGYRRTTADVWLRRFTSTDRYKGETHFLVWPKD